MCQTGNEVRIFADLDSQFFGDMIEKCGEEMYVFRENGSILHAKECCATELAILDVDMELSTTFCLGCRYNFMSEDGIH